MAAPTSLKHTPVFQQRLVHSYARGQTACTVRKAKTAAATKCLQSVVIIVLARVRPTSVSAQVYLACLEDMSRTLLTQVLLLVWTSVRVLILRNLSAQNSLSTCLEHTKLSSTVNFLRLVGRFHRHQNWLLVKVTQHACAYMYCRCRAARST